MTLHPDADGMPCVESPDGKFLIRALPFTKRDFEMAWSKARSSDSPFNDASYGAMLRVNPRASPASGGSWRLPLFLTGIDPDHTENLLKQIGGAILPTGGQWVDLHKSLVGKAFDREGEKRRLGDRCCVNARATLFRIWDEINPQTWAQATLLERGILEWVISPPVDLSENSTKFGAIGTPPKTIFVPGYDEPYHYSKGDKLTELHGFRVWRPKSRTK